MKKYSLIILVGISIVLAACSTNSIGGNNGSKQAVTPKPAVNVAYAASLENLFDNQISKGFTAQTGYKFRGYAGGSSLLANEIESKDLKADIFISAGTSVNSLVLNKAPIGIDYYIIFGSSPLVFGYTSNSKFYSQLKSKPWYKVVTEPGFRVGRTDPVLDPKGVLTVSLVKKEASLIGDPALDSIVTGNGNVFPEQDLVGRLESGQLDGGFFYLAEAVDQHILYQSMANLSNGAVYTVSILTNSTNKQGALAFMNYLLSSAAQKVFNANGIETPTSFAITGNRADVSASTLKIIASSKS